MKNAARVVRSLLAGTFGDALAFLILVGITASAAVLALISAQRQVQEADHAAIAEIADQVDATPANSLLSSSPDLAAAILLEDAFAALRPSESIEIAELRGRLVERGSEEAETIEIISLRNYLRSDPRFHVDSRTSVRLATRKQEKGRDC